LSIVGLFIPACAASIATGSTRRALAPEGELPLRRVYVAGVASTGRPDFFQPEIPAGMMNTFL
jgi:hypothetical protein